MANNKLAKGMGLRVRTARERAGIDQVGLASALGLSQSSLSNIERGDTLISLEHLVKLPELLRCRVTDLLPPEVVTPEDIRRAKDPLLEALAGLNDSQRRVIQANLEAWGLWPVKES